MNDTTNKAISIFKNGGIVIFPTDTAFGIGCRIDNREAVDRLFFLRKRSRTQAMPILVSSVEMALPYFITPSDIVRRLMKIYWPGALTIVAPCNKNLIYSPIRGDGETIGIRMPDYKDLLEVISAIGVPILGSSANFHGYPTPFTIHDLNSELIALADFVMEGTCSIKRASTVVNCSTDPYKIIRQGAVCI